MGNKLKILFLCTGNSCRSQMAEGWTRHLKDNIIDAFSAGIETHGLNPHAVTAMAEAGVNISRQKSKLLDELQHNAFDYVITVCSHAHEKCPLFPGTDRIIHAGFDDPPKMAKLFNNPEQKLDGYRKIRDEIRNFVMNLPENLTKQ
jgi:arsenate reductase